MTAKKYYLIKESTDEKSITANRMINEMKKESWLINLYCMTKRKLFIGLLIITIINALLFQFGPGLGGNYINKLDPILWTVPLGYILFGFVAAVPLSLIPFKNLSYRKKYLTVGFITSIILNGLIFFVGLSLILEYN